MATLPDSLPLVSVIIPVYNGADLIHEAIRSVAAQTYPRVETIVVDDGSEDAVTLQRVLADYPAVRLVRQPNRGVAAALNRGLREMNGAFFCWLSHDDLFHPHKIAREAQCCLEEGTETVIYSDYCYIDQDRAVLSFCHIPRRRPDLMSVLLLQHSWIHGCAMMIPKKCIDAVGGFDERLQTTQDYDLFFRLADHFRFRHIPETLAAVRLHRHQTTQRLSAIALKEQDDLYAKIVARIASDAVAKFSPTTASRFFSYLYRRFMFGLLPESAEAARRRAWLEAAFPLDRLWALASLAIANGLTTRSLRQALLRKSALRLAFQRRHEPLTWDVLLTKERSGSPASERRQGNAC